MLARWQVRWLAGRSEPRRPDGGQDRMGRLAWRIMSRSVGHGNGRAIEEAWRSWLRHPDQVRSEGLGRWPPSADAVKDASGVAWNPDRDTGDKRAIGTLCTRLGALPGDPVDRVLFYVLTGQADQRQAADPDGTLLATGYRALDPAPRELIRRAIADSGDLDLVRVLAGPSGHGIRLAEPEAAYLLDEFARRRDWRQLWRAVQHIPLADAITAMSRFGDGWHPDDEAGRNLFTLLSGTSAMAAGAARDALTAPSSVALVVWREPELQSTRDREVRCTFSPDGRYLTVAERLVGFSSNLDIEFWSRFEVRNGTRVSRVRHDFWRNSGGTSDVDQVESADGPFFATTRSGPGMLGMSAGDMRLSGTPVGDLWRLHQPLHPRDVLPYRDGFVFLHWPSVSSSQPGQIVFCDKTMRAVREVMLSGDLAMPDVSQRLLAVENDTGRLLLAGDRLRILAADPPRVIAASPPSDTQHATAIRIPASFLDPDHVLTHGIGDETRLWRRRGDRLETEAATDARLLAAFPARGEIAAVAGDRLQYHDARTLAVIVQAEATSHLRMLTAPNGRSYVRWRGWEPASGRKSLLGHQSIHYVEDAWPATAVALADTPLAGFSPSDLETVTAMLGYAGPSAARPFLALLGQCLEARFGAEITLGTGASVGPDEIGLGGADRQSEA